MSNLQYIGARYVPKFYLNPDDSSNDWKSGVLYEALTIVTYNNDSYTSKIAVPATVGNPADNPQYWACTTKYTAALMALQTTVQNLEDYVNPDLPLISGADSLAEGINFLTIFVTPEMFGAKGDGVQDDTAAIANAINFAKNNNIGVKCRKTTYKISQTINIPAIVFDGGNCIFTTSEAIEMVKIVENYGTVLRNLMLVGTNNASIGLACDANGLNAIIDNIRVSQCVNYGFKFVNSYLSHITNCYAYRCGTGFYFDSAYNIQIDRITSLENSIGLYISTMNSSVISQIDLSSNDVCCYINASNANTISGVYVEDSDSYPTTKVFEFHGGNYFTTIESLQISLSRTSYIVFDFSAASFAQGININGLRMTKTTSPNVATFIKMTNTQSNMSLFKIAIDGFAYYGSGLDPQLYSGYGFVSYKGSDAEKYYNVINGVARRSSGFNYMNYDALQDADNYFQCVSNEVQYQLYKYIQSADASSLTISSHHADLFVGFIEIISSLGSALYYFDGGNVSLVRTDAPTVFDTSTLVRPIYSSGTQSLLVYFPNTPFPNGNAAIVKVYKAN